MSVQSLAAKARRHWEQWLPERSRRLKEAGRFTLESQKAAEQAQREINQLRQAGYPDWAAEEIVLPQYILLPPEAPDPNDELEQELAEKEAYYQKEIAPLLVWADEENDPLIQTE